MKWVKAREFSIGHPAWSFKFSGNLIQSWNIWAYLPIFSTFKFLMYIFRTRAAGRACVTKDRSEVEPTVFCLQCLSVMCLLTTKCRYVSFPELKKWWNCFLWPRLPWNYYNFPQNCLKQEERFLRDHWDGVNGAYYVHEESSTSSVDQMWVVLFFDSITLKIWIWLYKRA